jgi:hypothetical protein
MIAAITTVEEVAPGAGSGEPMAGSMWRQRRRRR